MYMGTLVSDVDFGNVTIHIKVFFVPKVPRFLMLIWGKLAFIGYY